jgi:phosphotriesterase-related protein
MDEINSGVKETLNRDIKVKAAVIKIPFLGVLEDAYKSLTEAAVLASINTDIPLLIHTERGLNVEWFSGYLEDKGIKPQKVVFSHVDKRPDIKFHEGLAEKGYYLEYDTFLREKYQPEKTTYKLIDAMVKSGHSASIIIGSDIAGNSMWETIRDTTGYGGFFKILQKRFLNNYNDPEVTAGLISRNAARFLSMDY